MTAPGWSNFSRGMSAQGPFSALVPGHVSGAFVDAASQGWPLMCAGGLGWSRLEPLACMRSAGGAAGACLLPSGLRGGG